MASLRPYRSRAFAFAGFEWVLVFYTDLPAVVG